jgi:branched-chain amino acid transport system substrate-binding protein
MNKRLLSVFAVVSSALVVAAGCGGDDDDDGGGGSISEGGTYKVGYAASQTGRLAIFEEQFLKGLEAQVDAINAEGGIDGKVMIELDVRDCASDPQQCGVVAQELVDNGAQFLISPCDVDASLPAAQIAQREEIPILNSCGSGSSFREQVGDFAFLNVYGTVAEGEAMAEFAFTNQQYQSAAMMTSSDIEYTESIIDSATQRYEELGGQVVETQSFRLDQPQYTSQATAIAGSNPDVVMTSMFLPAANTFLQNLRAAGYDGPVIGPDGMEGQELFAAGNAASNVFVLTFGSPPGPQDTTQKFIDLYTQANGEPPQLIIAALGGDAAILIDAAVTDAGTTDGPAVRDALDNLENVLGATGEITYAGHGGVPAKDVVILETNVPQKRFDLVDRFVPEAVTGG